MGVDFKKHPFVPGLPPGRMERFENAAMDRRVQVGLVCRVQGSGFRVQGSGFRVEE